MSELLTAPNPEVVSFYNGLLNSHTLADYTPDNAVLVMDRPARLAGEAEEQEARYEQQRANRQQRGRIALRVPLSRRRLADRPRKVGAFRRLDG